MGSRKLFIILQATGLPPPKKHLMFSPASPQRAGQAMVALGMWKAAEFSQTLRVQNIKGSGPGLLTHAPLPRSLQWGRSCCLLTKMQPSYYFRVVRGGMRCFKLLLFPKATSQFRNKRTGFFPPVWNTAASSAGAQTLLGEETLGDPLKV